MGRFYQTIKGRSSLFVMFLKCITVLFLIQKCSSLKATFKDYDYDYYDYYDYYGYYDYYDYYDYSDYDYDSYYINSEFYDCDDNFCFSSKKYVSIDKESSIGDTKLVEVINSVHAIKTSSAIDECTPSLTDEDFAAMALGCWDDAYIQYNYPFSNYELVKICEYRRKGWLNEDGTINEDELLTKYNELGGVSEEIFNILSSDESGYGYGEMRMLARNNKKKISHSHKRKREEDLDYSLQPKKDKEDILRKLENKQIISQ